jgi:phosphoribosyl 1,2-cyclic phosphodiesterase
VGLAVTSLGSGSSGNALLLRSSTSAILVDCGVSIRRLSQSLAAHALMLPDIDAILVSHEHVDHVREIDRFATMATAILSTKGTASAIQPVANWTAITGGETRAVANVEVTAIPVSHDASEPCGFFIRVDGRALTVLTDLGSPSDVAAEAIAASDLVVLEANHDVSMLRRGPYPLHLQRRILSDVGHLSNDDCASLLLTALDGTSRLPTVWLAHLSETNNRPHLAAQTVRRQLARAGIHLEVQALPRRDIGPTWQPGRGKPGVSQLRLELL